MGFSSIIQRVRRYFAARKATLPSIFLTQPIPRLATPSDKPSISIPDALHDRTTFYAWQRNHMANERTFLAWCRTGISLIVFGFVIERFDLLIRELRTFSAHPEAIHYAGRTRYLGLVTFLLGAFITVMAGWRFFYLRRHINRGEPEFSATPDIFLLVSILGTFAMIFFLFVSLL
jgi:putative membrane protein